LKTSGYTTKEAIVAMLQREISNNADGEALEMLMDEIRQIRVNEDQSIASNKMEAGTSLMTWLGFDIYYKKPFIQTVFFIVQESPTMSHGR
jgi:hypothetical protein